MDIRTIVGAEGEGVFGTGLDMSSPEYTTTVQKPKGRVLAPNPVVQSIFDQVAAIPVLEQVSGRVGQFALPPMQAAGTLGVVAGVDPVAILGAPVEYAVTGLAHSCALRPHHLNISGKEKAKISYRGQNGSRGRPGTGSCEKFGKAAFSPALSPLFSITVSRQNRFFHGFQVRNSR